MKKRLAIGSVLLGIGVFSLSGCSGSDSSTTGAGLPQMNVTMTSQEFDESDYAASLEQARRDDRTYDIDPTAQTSSRAASETTNDALAREREFDTRAVSSELQRVRFDSRLGVPSEASSSDEPFNYDTFIAQMTELRAQQRAGNYFKSSSSARSTSSTTGGSYLRSLPKYPQETFFNRSSRSSSSAYSAGSFLNRSSASSLSSSSSSTGGLFNWSLSSSSASSNGLSSAASSVSSGPAECGDGRDNDNDGTIDADDPQCHTDGNAEYLPSYDNRRRSETTGLTQGGSASSSTMLAVRSSGNGCSDRSIIPALGDNALTGDEGATFPSLINGDCGITGAMLPVWGGNQETIFGSLDF